MENGNLLLNAMLKGEYKGELRLREQGNDKKEK